MMLFALRESRELGDAIASEAGTSLAPLEERSFEGGEFKLRPMSSVRGRQVCVVQSLAGGAGTSPSESLLRLLLLCMGLRDAGAAEVIALIPYLAFARKDRRTQPRDPVTARYVAQLLEAAGVSQVIGLDVHNTAAFDNAFRVPTMHLSAQPLLAAQLAPGIARDGIVIASPDVGGIKRVQLFAEMLGHQVTAPVDLAFIEKRRVGGRVSGGAVTGQVRNRRVLVLDDLCASGGTLVRAAGLLRAAGASSVQVAVTHAPLPPGIATLLAAEDIAHVMITDSTGPWTHSLRAPRLEVLELAPLLGTALRRLAAGQPLTPLLESWPPRN
jgi:ribose-phosphate pyrophosphokinase